MSASQTAGPGASATIDEVLDGLPRPAPRSCAGCDVVDTDPRHVGAALVDDTPPQPWHHDCHAAVGCRVCIDIVRKAGGVTGDEMLAAKIAMDPSTPFGLVDGQLVHADPTALEG